MADTKISALPASTTPLAGTEVLPIVQSSTTKQVSVANLTAGRAVSALSLTSTNDSTINGLAVGKGGGSVASNTAFGVSALAGNSAGIRSSAVGYRALVGATGNFNAAFGSNTFESLTSGTNGTAIGDYALQQTTGSFNTALGNGAGYLISSGAKNTVIGLYSGNQGGVDIRTTDNNVILSDGDGNVAARWANGGGWYQLNNAVNWSITSDARVKENVQTIENGLNVITGLRPVEFDYILSKQHMVGFIAQEYENVLPDQIIEDANIGEELKELTNGEPVKGIQQNLVPYLVAAIKEQQALITTLTERIAALETK